VRREAEGAVVEPSGDMGLRVQFELLRGLSEAEAFLEERDGGHGRDIAAGRLGVHKVVPHHIEGWWKDTGKPGCVLEVNGLTLDGNRDLRQ
jgi:hypothetical protein